MRHNILFVILAVTLATDVVSSAENPQKKCMEETGAQIPDLAASLKQDVKNVDEKVKNYYACLLKSFKLMRDDGTMDVEKINKDFSTMSEAEGKEAEKCYALKGDSVGDTAFLIAMCVMTSQGGKSSQN